MWTTPFIYAKMIPIGFDLWIWEQVVGGDILIGYWTNEPRCASLYLPGWDKRTLRVSVPQLDGEYVGQNWKSWHHAVANQVLIQQFLRMALYSLVLSTQVHLTS
jgi:hypothetical protein